jgi:hypothetical protein
MPLKGLANPLLHADTFFTKDTIYTLTGHRKGRSLGINGLTQGPLSYAAFVLSIILCSLKYLEHIIDRHTPLKSGDSEPGQAYHGSA